MRFMSITLQYHKSEHKRYDMLDFAICLNISEIKLVEFVYITNVTQIKRNNIWFNSIYIILY